MAKENVTRKLAAILYADVVGYSRLTGADEEGTHKAVAEYLDAIAEMVSGHDGRVVHYAGDAVLADFPSVVATVKCAVEVQKELAVRNAGLPDDRKVQFRIGVNLGDVIVDRDDIYGNGVNVAARLEALADPGGVCVSGAVLEQVQDKIDVDFEDMGPQEVKNIAKPMQAYRVIPGNPLSRAAPPPLPEKPSIAVLPFDNMSGDPAQEYFADGITEDIITAFSKFRWFFVISRNSTFMYKGQAIDIKQVGRELGVRYVLEGSVRKAENRVRVSAQLIDAATGNQIWAERFDRTLEDVFELQDEITTTIAAAVEPELSGLERDRAMRKPTKHLDAWDTFHRGMALIWQQDRTSIEAGRNLARQAIELDPTFGRAYGLLAFSAAELLVYEWADNRDEMLQQGIADAGKAISIDQRDYFAYNSLGRLHTLAGDFAAAIRALEKCVMVNPNFASGYLGLAEAHVYGGDPKKALEYADMAIRLSSPINPNQWDILHYKASAFVRLENFDRAIEIFEQVCEFPTAQYVPHATLAALYVIQRREAEGQRALQNARRLEPKLSIALMKNIYGVSKDRPGTRTRRLLDALRTAGLAER